MQAKSRTFEVQVERDGRWVMEAVHDVIKRLNKLLSEKHLPMTKRILLGRVARGLRGIQPLTKEGPAADRKIFKQVIKAIAAYGGLHGGPVLSDAIARRGRMVLGKGPLDLPPGEALDKIVAMLPTRAIRLGYLLDLGASEFAEKYNDAVLRSLARVVEELQTMSRTRFPWTQNWLNRSVQGGPEHDR